MPLPIVRTVVELRSVIEGWRRAGDTIALIPTMGALHAGHLDLVKWGKVRASRTVTSVFVNPTQFGPSEDFSRYPRNETADAALLAEVGCDLMFAPSVSDMYPKGFSTAIDVGPVATRWEADFRPGHFQGVATVVAKLLLMAHPDVACFGEKDYQQLQVIRRLVQDLDIAVRIEGVPTMRDTDGLALSSRNAYLTPRQRAIAGQLNQVLRALAARLTEDAQSVATSLTWGRQQLAAIGVDAVDYLAVVDPTTLDPVTIANAHSRIITTVRLGSTRLLDNLAVGVAHATS